MIDPRAEFWDEKIETISRDELANLQLQKLQWQVQRCWDGSEFYRERLEQVGVSPSEIQSLDDVRKIPIVTKQELRDEQLAHPPYGRYTVGARANWSELHPSTGTTGVPVAQGYEVSIQGATGCQLPDSVPLIEHVPE